MPGWGTFPFRSRTRGFIWRSGCLHSFIGNINPGNHDASQPSFKYFKANRVEMIFRNSIYSIIRSWGKTIIFLLVIFALTLALSLGVSVWASVSQFLKECEDYYTTIGLVEYMGEGYPHDTAYDPVMADALAQFDATTITSDAATLSWETPHRTLGSVDGFWRTDPYMPYRMFSVLVVGNVAFNETHHQYSGTVYEVPYSSRSEAGTLILIDDDFGTFEPGRIYLVFGEVYQMRSPLRRLRVIPADVLEGFPGGQDLPRVVDITADGIPAGYQIPPDSRLLQVADLLRVLNNSVMISATDNLMALYPFHQQELYFVQGRPFTDEEYENGSRVAVISELMAARLGIGLGDAIDLSVAMSDRPGLYNTYDAALDVHHISHTVVGITNTVMDKSWYVYTPRSAGVPFTAYPVGYAVGQAVLRNDQAADFMARVEKQLPERFQISVYDQGYSTVAIPFETILTIARIVTGVCVLVQVAVLVLFGFLFVYRQRETGETMLMLGASRLQVGAHFLISAGMIALLASGSGAVAGYRLHDVILRLVSQSVGDFALVDARYSNGNLTVARTLEFAPHLPWSLFAWVGAAVVAFALLACAGFVISNLRQRRAGRKNVWKLHRRYRTSHLPGGGFKFAMLSVLRGGWRSLVALLLALCVVLFFGQLAGTVERYNQQLEAIYDNTTIAGYHTDIYGKQLGHQVLAAYDVGNLYHSGLISNLSVSVGTPFYYLGISRTADGGDGTAGQLLVPTNGFAYESLQADIQAGPELTATNQLRTVPEFFHSDTIRMDFLEDYDETFLSVSRGDPYVRTCLITTAFMARHDIHMGDTIRVAINQVTQSTEDGARIFRHFDLKVVGSYVKQGTADTIYAPLALFFDTRLIWGDSPTNVDSVEGNPREWSAREKDVLQSSIFHSASFELRDSHKLGEFKDYLTDYGYSQVNHVGRVREFIVIRDATFNNAVASVKQQIRYINTLYPFLYILVGIIALGTAFLMVASRKMELAIMRGLGATRAETFFGFFLEQAFLCLMGTGAGMAFWRFMGTTPNRLHWLLLIGFLGCYLGGGAISILVMMRASALTNLLDRE